MREISVYDLKLNPMEMFSHDWAALTAGDHDDCNSMTIAWGSLGSIWGRANGDGKHLGIPIATVYVRPQRYTKRFMDHHDYFSISFFNGYKKELGYLGSRSGRNEDKIRNAGLSTDYDDGTPYIKEADLVFICKKIYQDWFADDHFRDQEINRETYPIKDYHEFYIGEIEKVLIREDRIGEYT